MIINWLFPSVGVPHEQSLRQVKNNDFISGQYIWTGFDYLGEPTPYGWPARSSYFGIVDLAGLPKDIYYLYQSEWTNKDVLHLFPHWNWTLGQEIDMWAYYNHEVMEKKDLRAPSVKLRGLNFRISKEFYRQLDKKMTLERHPQSASRSESRVSPLSVEQRYRLLEEYLQQYPCISRAQYARLAGRSVKQAVTDLNLFIEDGLLMKFGAGRNVVYVIEKGK